MGRRHSDGRRRLCVEWSDTATLGDGGRTVGRCVYAKLCGQMKVLRAGALHGQARVASRPAALTGCTARECSSPVQAEGQSNAQRGSG